MLRGSEGCGCFGKSCEGCRLGALLGKSDCKYIQIGLSFVTRGVAAERGRIGGLLMKPEQLRTSTLMRLVFETRLPLNSYSKCFA